MDHSVQKNCHGKSVFCLKHLWNIGQAEDLTDEVWDFVFLNGPLGREASDIDG